MGMEGVDGAERGVASPNGVLGGGSLISFYLFEWVISFDVGGRGNWLVPASATRVGILTKNE